MLAVVGRGTLDELADAAVPPRIREDEPAGPARGAASEPEVLAELRGLAARNRVADADDRARLPRHAHPAGDPAQRAREPGLVHRLHAVPAGDQPGPARGAAELPDHGRGPHRAADSRREPARRGHRGRRGDDAWRRRASKVGADVFVVDADTHPQTLAVLRTRAEPLGIERADLRRRRRAAGRATVFGVLLSYPGPPARSATTRALIEAAHERGALVAVATDLLALTLLRPPGELGADVAVGQPSASACRSGFGGPHAAFMSRARRPRAQAARPARRGQRRRRRDARRYRLALQTREQHIRREKATSQHLHRAGPAGRDGRDVRRLPRAARAHGRSPSAPTGSRPCSPPACAAGGSRSVTDAVLRHRAGARCPAGPMRVAAAARERGINLRRVDADTVGDLRRRDDDPRRTSTRCWAAFGVAVDSARWTTRRASRCAIPGCCATSAFLTHPVFNTHHSETAMLRYLRRAVRQGPRARPRDDPARLVHDEAQRDHRDGADHLAGVRRRSTRSRPLEETVGHPRADPPARGSWLVEITGYDAVSLQPNAGSQGELAGLLAIRAYHRAPGDAERDVCLIPSARTAPTPPSAVMAGMRVVVVACDEQGNVDLDDLRAKIERARRPARRDDGHLPVDARGVRGGRRASCAALVHDAGGQVYVDGANLNALVGLAQPGRFGADVSHLNLHKTFCIPHGGGGPGVGPVAVRAHLAPYLPEPPAGAGGRTAAGRCRSGQRRPVGSAGILPISWAYVRLMGGEGLTAGDGGGDPRRRTTSPTGSTPHYPVLYTGPRRARRARVHRRPAADHQGHRRHRRRRGQAAHRLRLPRADDVASRSPAR